MASSVRQLHHRLFRLSRRYCCGGSAVSPPEPEGPTFSQIRDGLYPSVVALHTHFSGGGAPNSASIGTGVFVDTRLIVTTASTVGRLSTFYDSGSRSVLHNCLISRTIALTEEGKSLRTTPVAVNFSGDLAVLEVAEVEGDLPPPCTVANVFEEKETAVITLARREDYTEIIMYVPHLRKTVRPKSPWPLEEELGWVDYGVSAKYLGSKNVKVKIANFTGSPWFNDRKEIVGYASWAAADAGGDVKSYAVPASRIRSMIDYAKSKGPHDPIVMDRWIKEYAISDDNPAIIKEGVPAWYTYVVVHIGKHSLIGRWTGESLRNVLEY